MKNPGRYIVTSKGTKAAVYNKDIGFTLKVTAYPVDDNFDLIKDAKGLYVDLSKCKLIGFFD